MFSAHASRTYAGSLVYFVYWPSSLSGVQVRAHLVLSQQWQVQQDLDGLSVSRHDDELADAAVKRLGRLVGTLLKLLVVGSLLDDV